MIFISVRVILLGERCRGFASQKVRVAAKFKLRRMGGVVFPFDCCGGV
jgi:hypothetical protein